MLQLFSAPLAITFLLSGDLSQGLAVEASAALAPTVPACSTAALLERPELRLGEARTVTVQYCREIEDWNPFLTRFDPEVYRCIEVWSDEQWLWIKEEYDAPEARFFAREGTVVGMILSSARPHDRYELEVVVREVHAGRAWIEIVDARWTEQQIPEGTILHTIRALEMVDREGWAIASSELNRALRPNLPGHVRRELETIKATCDGVLEARRKD